MEMRDTRIQTEKSSQFTRTEPLKRLLKQVKKLSNIRMECENSPQTTEKV